MKGHFQNAANGFLYYEVEANETFLAEIVAVLEQEFSF